MYSYNYYTCIFSSIAAPIPDLIDLLERVRESYLELVYMWDL